MEDHLDYTFMIQEALRDVVRQALEHVQELGLPSQHHFYIAFRTDDPEVLIGEDLKQQYPDEMTIVVQHQYRDLDVESDRFTIGLNFNGVPRSLVVPFSAITAFSDPSVNFGLRFQSPDEAEPEAEAGAEATPQSSHGGNVVSFDAARKNR